MVLKVTRLGPGWPGWNADRPFLMAPDCKRSQTAEYTSVQWRNHQALGTI
jgi:hypothetical protein